MLSKKKATQQNSMFFGLEDMLNQKHPMYILTNKVNWQMFEDSFSPLYCSDNGSSSQANPADGMIADNKTFTQYFG
jgi:hypothetical protein